MDYILQFARILGFCLAGEVLHFFLPLPIPASIYGLLLMFLALQTGRLKLESVKPASAFLIAVFPIMFVPGTVGVMDLWAELAVLLIPMLLATFAITALVFAVTGHVTQALTKDPEALNSIFRKLLGRFQRKPDTAEATPDKAEATPDKAEATSDKTEATSDKAEETPDKEGTT